MTAEPLRVLNLVTTPRPFYDQQVRVLEDAGVETDTVAVPGRTATDGSRSVVDYARYYPSVLRASLDDYDLVHANYGLTAPFALAQPVRPVVLSLWGSDLMGRPSALVKRCAPLFDEVVVMSEAMAAELDEDVTVVPHGVDFETFEPGDRATAREGLGWSDDEKHVLFPYDPGRDVKDYPTAESVVDRVDGRLETDVTLQVVHGVDHDDLVTYMNAADAMLLTSRREGSPNALKEALACNLPVVARDVGDAAERVRGVAPSRVCEDDADLPDALAAVLRADRRSNGRAVSGDLRLETMQSSLLDVYADALGETGTRDAGGPT